MEVRAEGKWAESGMSEIAGAVIAWNMESEQTRIIIEEAAIGWPRGAGARSKFEEKQVRIR